MTTILVRSDDAAVWRDNLLALRPDLDVRVWPEIGDPAKIEHALVWGPPPGLLASLPNLKAIFSVGAGVDHILRDPTLPPGPPIIRMLEPGLTEGMTEWVVMQVLNLHRRSDAYRAQQTRREWRQLPQKLGRERTVGVLGLGVLGADAARALAALRFRVVGWSRTEKTVPGVLCRHGADGFVKTLRESEILVNLLPLTPETKGILNEKTLAALPKGAALVNAARGAHVVEGDLIEELDSGQLSAAVLDVFQTEPLPPDHPFWTHPKITITPHVASVTHPRSAAAAVIDNLRRIEAGEEPFPLVDRARGY